jgi:phosphohistidine phosphatase
MKKLILIRHADANKTGGTSDFNAPITIMGKNQAEALGREIGDLSLDLILTSPAKRAVDTLSLILDHLPNSYAEKVFPIRDLYDSAHPRMIEIIKNQLDNITTLMIVGHNPMIYHTAVSLTSVECPDRNILEKEGMTTGQLLLLEFKNLASWRNLKEDSGFLIKNFSSNMDYFS